MSIKDEVPIFIIFESENLLSLASMKGQEPGKDTTVKQNYFLDKMEHSFIHEAQSIRKIYSCQHDYRFQLPSF